jgi:hypothetical protein
MTDQETYRDWRSLELAIKEAAKKAAKAAGPHVSAARIDAQIRQARFDRFLSRVFADGEHSEWLLKGGMSMLARVPRSRTTKDMDLAAQHAADLDSASQALTNLVDTDLSDHLTFRLIGSAPTGLGDNQPGVATRRITFACIDADHDTQIAATAKGVPLASDMTAAAASDLVATFIDPALDTASDPATWIPDNLTWATDAIE